MEKDKSSNTKRISLLTTGGLMLISAFLFWICDVGAVYALCFGSAGLCFFAAGLNVKNENKD